MSKHEYDPKQGAVAFFKHMKELVAIALDAPAVTDEDRKDLEIAQRNLDSFDQLDQHFIAPLLATRPTAAANGYELLWKLMSAACSVGSRATVSDSADRYVVDQEKKVRRPARMRDARARGSKGKDGSARIGTDEQRKALEAMILAYAAGDTSRLSSTRHKTRPALDDVCTELAKKFPSGGLPENYPSEGTLRAAIQRLKKTLRRIKAKS
jgi:hypothetical protein